jgi:hypothetical protein
MLEMFGNDYLLHVLTMVRKLLISLEHYSAQILLPNICGVTNFV